MSDVRIIDVYVIDFGILIEGLVQTVFSDECTISVVIRVRCRQ
jgi:hypothetical protein